MSEAEELLLLLRLLVTLPVGRDVPEIVILPLLTVGPTEVAVEDTELDEFVQDDDDVELVLLVVAFDTAVTVMVTVAVGVGVLEESDRLDVIDADAPIERELVGV